MTLKVIETDDEYNLTEVIPFHFLGGMQRLKESWLPVNSNCEGIEKQKELKKPLVMAIGVGTGGGRGGLSPPQLFKRGGSAPPTLKNEQLALQGN